MPDEELKKLPPEERIKKLKELEQKRKKEIEEAQKLIQESEKEITERRKWLEKVPLPQVAREDLEELSGEEKEILKVHKGMKEKKKGKKEEDEKSFSGDKRAGEKSLEEALAREQGEIPPEILHSQYTVKLSRTPIQELYQEMSQIKQEVEEKGYVNKEEQRRVQYLSAALERKFEDVETGRYSLTEEVAQAALLTQQWGADLRGMYQQKAGRKRNEWYQNEK